MSKSDAFETALMLLLFNNTTWAGIGDVTGIVGSGAAGNLYASLHTASPGETGDQTTNEATYTSYARVPKARSGAGWTVTGNSVSPASAITFPAGTGGSGTITHFGIGSASSGAGILIYYGTVTPSLSTGAGITPQLSTVTAITED